ncbi:MAG: aldo/keto reductase [Spirochaetia bacterium]|nr:aldo/keto reductase [Spirochaetia bacterium]
MKNKDFIYRNLPLIKKRVHRLGLSFNHGIDGKGVETALKLGMNYIFWTRFGTGEAFDVIKTALKNERQKYVLAAGVTLGFFKGSLRKRVEKLCREFDIDYVDVFQLYWLGRMSFFTKGIQKELVRLRDEGLVRALGVSIHDRKRAGRLAVESVLDLLMIRYNAAHPGAEVDIFPNYEKRRPITIAYTATSWRKLLKPPKRWEDKVMTAGDCYRFCLTNRHVDVVLCGPANENQLIDNLKALEKGPLSSAEDEYIRRFGKAVRGS